MSHVTDPRIEQELQVVRLNSFEHLNTVYNEVPPKKVMRIFEYENNLIMPKFHQNENLWRIKKTSRYKNGTKIFYVCRHDRKCSARACLFVPKTSHDHVESMLKPNIKMNETTKEEIIRLFSKVFLITTKNFQIILVNKTLLNNVNKSDSVHINGIYKLNFNGFPVLVVGTTDVTDQRPINKLE
ncbi:hypothetical protein BLOT_016496, partial [Blomia tropicalis]